MHFGPKNVNWDCGGPHYFSEDHSTEVVPLVNSHHIYFDDSDGASVMLGKESKSLYRIHCMAHKLHLVIIMLFKNIIIFPKWNFLIKFIDFIIFYFLTLDINIRSI